MESGRHQQLSSTEPCARHHHQHSRLILTPLGKALLCPCYRLWGRKARKCPWASVPRHWAPPSCRWTCGCPKGAKMLHKAKPWQHPSLPPAATKPQPLLLGIQRPDLSTPEISFWWLNLFIFYLPKRSLSLFLFFFFLIFWPPHSACGILVPWPGIKPYSLLVKHGVHHWTTREFPKEIFPYIHPAKVKCMHLYVVYGPVRLMPLSPV